MLSKAIIQSILPIFFFEDSPSSLFEVGGTPNTTDNMIDFTSRQTKCCEEGEIGRWADWEKEIPVNKVKACRSKLGGAQTRKIGQRDCIIKVLGWANSIFVGLPWTLNVLFVTYYKLQAKIY